MNFDFLEGELIFYKLQLSLLSPRGLERIKSMGGGGGGSLPLCIQLEE